MMTRMFDQLYAYQGEAAIMAASLISAILILWLFRAAAWHASITVALAILLEGACLAMAMQIGYEALFLAPFAMALLLLGVVHLLAAWHERREREGAVGVVNASEEQDMLL